MGKINSNLFDLDLDDILNYQYEGEIINTLDYKVNVEEVYKNFSNTLIYDSKKSRGKVSVEAIEFKHIDITKENFSENQYNILKHSNIAMNISDDIYSFLTPDGVIYKFSDPNLINTIMNTPRPRKIVYDLPCYTKSVYSMQLLASILENIKSNSISELLSEYGYEYTDYNNALNILLSIFPIYEQLIYKYQYNNYISKENKIYSIFKNISYNIDNSKLSQRTEEIDNEIIALCENLKIETILDFNPLDFLNYIVSLNDNSFTYPSLNTELLNSIGFIDYSNLIDLLSEKNYIESINNGSLLIDTYFNAGLKSVPPLIDQYTNKLIIKGSYQHLFQNIIADLLNNPEYINYVNDDKNILNEILASKNVPYNENTLILLSWALNAHITGCNTIEDYRLYFLTNKSTVLCDNDVSSIVNLLNNELHELIELIDSASSKTLKHDNLILHGDFSPFHKMVLNVQRKLTKNLISEVYDYIIDFNNKNKSQINFIGYYDNSIYLECEESSLSVALDTLTRTMVRIYDKYLKKTKATCIIETLNK